MQLIMSTPQPLFLSGIHLLDCYTTPLKSQSQIPGNLLYSPAYASLSFQAQIIYPNVIVFCLAIKDLYII